MTHRTSRLDWVSLAKAGSQDCMYLCPSMERGNVMLTIKNFYAFCLTGCIRHVTVSER